MNPGELTISSEDVQDVREILENPDSMFHLKMI